MPLAEFKSNWLSIPDSSLRIYPMDVSEREISAQRMIDLITPNYLSHFQTIKNNIGQTVLFFGARTIFQDIILIELRFSIDDETNQEEGSIMVKSPHEWLSDETFFLIKFILDK